VRAQIIAGCSGSNVMAQRNYACNAHMRLVFDTDNSAGLNATGPRAITYFLFIVFYLFFFV
jgi:hypothetical protein